MRKLLLTTTHLTALGYNNDNGTDFNTPLGRIVWGHPLKPQDKMKDGVKVLDTATGLPVKRYAFGVAFPKAEFEAQVWPVLHAEASKMYPNAPPTFSWKYHDGDSTAPVWNNGKEMKPYAQREGYPGHYVVTFSTEFEVPQCVVFSNGAYHQIDESKIKTGDFVSIGANTKVHAGATPGLYVNPRIVLLQYEGDALSGSYTADPTQAFGAAPQMAAMPAGARPVGAPAPVGSPAPGGMPAPGNAQLPSATMPGAPSALPVAAASPPPVQPPAVPATPGRPTDPSHVHDMGNGTEQWLVNGQWDGIAHPVAPATPAAPALPPPAAGFVAAATGMPGAPAAGGMPMMPPR